MRFLIALLAFLASCVPAFGIVAYEQPPSATGGVLQSSWLDPDGSDADQYVWDSFILTADTPITEIRWRGGFQYNGMYGGPVINFTVAIYPSTPGLSQPDIVHPPLVEYETNGNANQTVVGNVNGIVMYDYRFTLPSAFQATAGARYWVHIYAWQHGLPDWGLSRATGGNGSHFRRLSDYMYQSAPGDAAFSLHTTGGATYTINASATPSNAGGVLGAGVYPAGTSASLVATPNAGYGFVRWTENGSPVSNSPTYTFVVNADRTLVANFTTAYSITTSASPVYAGSTSGGGTVNAGSSVTVSATPSPGFMFVNWTEFGTPVSTAANYTFTASASRTLVANFTTINPSVTFDLDNAPVHTSLPVSVSAGGISAQFTATGSGFSIQPANTLGLTPAGFGGLCIYPNSVFPADLLVSFSQPMTGFFILYSPQELGCDDSATMRVTAYMDSAFIGTATTTAPQPGTWPTGALSITTAAPFNRVVVHYEARPPTCQDYGPIFLADNMIVTPAACDAPSVSVSPTPVNACHASNISFTAGAAGSDPMAFAWQR